MNRITLSACATALLLIILPVAGATYYVDFDDGADTNPGTSPAAPFKHSPGDPNATGVPASTILRAGDTVIFKGGVHYRGTIVVRQGGTYAMPLVFDGNTAGDFGEGRAIIDGSEPVTKWTQCQSAAEANGNPNWANIYWAYIPPPAADVFHVNLCEGDRLLRPAQDPPPSDPFYQDRIDTYVPIRSPIPYDIGGQTHYADAAYFTQPDGYWGDDAYIGVYARDARVYRRRVLDYIAAENKVIFEQLNASQYPAGQGRFTMFNALRILDQPGEYYVRLTPEPNGMHKIFVWPYEDTSKMTLSTRRLGFNLRNSGITIQGFIIEKQGNERFPSAVLCDDDGRHNLTIRDNIIRFVRQRNEPGYRSGVIHMNNVTNAVIDGNEIVENPGAHAAHLNRFHNSVLSNNYIYKAGASAVVLYRSDGSGLIGNRLHDNRGMHANGLTVYVGCSNILIEGNHVSFGGSCLALQDSTGVIVRNNLFDGSGMTNCISLWNISTTADLLITHNTLVNSGDAWRAGIFGQSPGDDPHVVTITNNIIDGLYGTLPGTIRYNLYTSLNSHTLGPGEILQPNMDLLFVDHRADNYRLLPTAAAVDRASATWAVATDFDGRRRPTKAGYDMGAFEADELAADAGTDRLIWSPDDVAIVTLDGSASRAPTSTIIAYVWSKDGTGLGAGETLDVTLPAGENEITLTVYDDRGISNSHMVTLTIAAFLVANAGDDRVVVDEDDAGFALVMLDGTGSFDPDGAITEYLWTDAQGGLVGFGATVYTVLGHGEHTLTLRVTNAKGERATDTVVITVEPPSALLPGDANGDGRVDLDDFMILKANFGMASGATWADGDFNDDGKVDLDDFMILKANFGAVAP